MASSTPVKVHDVLGELDELCVVVESLLGPTQGKVLLENASGGVVVTNDGSTILDAITLDHPVARMIVDSCKAHHKRYGDGTKSMLLMTRAGLKSLCRNQHLPSTSTQRSNARQKVLSSLSWFKSRCLASQKLEEWLLDEAGSRCSLKDDCRGMFWPRVRTLVETPLRGKFSDAAVEMLGEITWELLSKSCSDDPTRLQQRVSTCMENFDLLSVAATGPRVDQSQIVEGVLIKTSGAFSPPATSAKCIFAQLDDNFTPETSAELGPSVAAAQWLSFPTKLCSEWVQRICKLGVSVVIYQGRALETLRTCCAMRDVTLLDCMPLDEFTQLANAIGVHVVDDVTETFGFETVFEAKFEEMHLGKDIYLNVRLTNRATPLYSVVLCSPSPGLCTQYKNAVYNSLLTVRHWLETSTGPDSKLRSVRGGACLFVKLHRLLQNQDLFQPVAGLRFAGNEAENFRMCSEVVGEMLMEVPRVLHCNDPKTKDKNNRFVQQLCNIEDRCLDEGLHPFVCQMAVLSDALHALCEAIRVDAMIGT